MDGSARTLANGQQIENVGLVDQAGMAWGTADNPFNTAAVALAPGAATAANQALLVAGVGAPADAAWSGTGAGTVIAILKAIWTGIGSIVTKLGTTLSVTGTVTVSANVVTATDNTLTANTKLDVFGSTAPPGGWAIYNPDPTYDIWASDSVDATVNGVGCIRIQANGGWYETPDGYKPPGKVRIISAGAAKFTGRSW